MVNKKPQEHTAGFALLLTLLVVTVLISIGVSVLSLSTKQVRLATNAKDSEIAFHAANAGLECGLYWRRTASSSMEVGDNILPIGCFGQVLPATNYQMTNIPSEDVSGGDAYRYKYEFEWGSPQRCALIDTIVGIATLNEGGLEIQNMTDYVVGYPKNTKECEAGTRCTVISVQGYNKPCGEITDYGTVQREVLLQL